MQATIFSPIPERTTSALSPELTTVRFCGVAYFLPGLGEEEFNQLFDRVVDDAADLDERLENMSAGEFIANKERYQRQQSLAYFNLELLETECKRRGAA